MSVYLSNPTKWVDVRYEGSKVCHVRSTKKRVPGGRVIVIICHQSTWYLIDIKWKSIFILYNKTVIILIKIIILSRSNRAITFFPQLRMQDPGGRTRDFLLLWEGGPQAILDVLQRLNWKCILVLPCMNIAYKELGAGLTIILCHMRRWR